ncbi:tRNA-binding protein [Candidatus Woesearchaeota archaeon]|nr:tRNA-binding protein [Candidatus Woesearchaeota archaeon]
MITFDDFLKVDIRVGKIVEIKDFPEARSPAYKLKIDFGKEIGIKTSSAQLVREHPKEELLGILVMAVINFPPKMIGGFKSEVLTLGVPGRNGQWTLIGPYKDVEIGGRMK